MASSILVEIRPGRKEGAQCSVLVSVLVLVFDIHDWQ